MGFNVKSDKFKFTLYVTGYGSSRIPSYVLIVISTLVALMLTFWGRLVFGQLLHQLPKPMWTIIAKNVASFGFWAILAGFVRTSDVELVKTVAWVPYAFAQSLWLAIDLIAAKAKAAR